MIINPIIYGSGAGLNPLIRVVAPVGSSVQCNGETKVVTDTSVDFKVNVSATAYTVTKVGTSQSQSVLVDKVALYSVTFS